MYDIIIIGAGTAGLSAAVYGVRAGKKVLVIEEKSYGGQIVNTPEVENYPGIKKISGYEFAENLYEQAVSHGTEIIYEKANGIENSGNKKIVVTDKNKYEGKSVIIATGAKSRPLGLEEEDKLIGAGVSYCATCDGAFFKGKTVAVAGGGNTALEEAIFLSDYCEKVYIIHRRSEFRGEKKLSIRLSQKKNVEFVMESRIIKLNGNNRLESLEVFNTVTEEIKTIPVAGLFVAVGQMPDNRAFENVADTDDYGYVKASEDCKTKSDGIFTAGDCRTKTVRQLATAAADGAVAALAACEYIG